MADELAAKRQRILLRNENGTDDALVCRTTGCESEWFHLSTVGLGKPPVAQLAYTVGGKIRAVYGYPVCTECNARLRLPGDHL